MALTDMDSCRYFKILWAVIFVGLFVLGSGSVVCAEDSYKCTGELYKDQSFSKPETTFSFLDTVYLKVTCTELPPGSYTIVSDWINPLGKLTRQNSFSFELMETTGYMTYSWMKLVRKGPLQRMFTGQDVDMEQYGEWVVKAYLRGVEVVTKQFTLH